MISTAPTLGMIFLIGLQERKKENKFLVSLGKYKEEGGCLYVNKLSDINTKELEKIIKLAIKRNS